MASGAHSADVFGNALKLLHTGLDRLPHTNVVARSCDAMRPPMPPRAPPASGTVHPNLLRKQTLLQRAQQAAQQHNEADGEPDPEVISGDWKAFWDNRQHVEVSERKASFQVYTAGSSGPVLFCVHGGGYTGLSFSLIADAMKDRCALLCSRLAPGNR